MGRSVGIDLGTTNSVVAVIEAGKPVIIPLAEGGTLCPSVVAFNVAGETMVGKAAKHQATTNPTRTIRSIKRQMGTKATIRIDEAEYTPEQISALILQKLKTDAEAYLGEEVTEAVITVPAYFSNAQREATKNSGEIAGIQVVRIVNEPTAAALAYGQDRDESKIVLVWDLGGGTYDVSILEQDHDVFEVRATSGDSHLGGDDWDAKVVDWVVDEFKTAHPDIDLRADLVAMQRIVEAAEAAKIELSTVLTTKINLPFLITGPDGPIHYECDLSRARLEEMTADLVRRMVGPAHQALDDARLKPENIDRILLVGGATRMPMVQEVIRDILIKEPFKGINPDEVVALGASIQAGIIRGDVRDLVLVDVTPLSLGIETQGGVFTRLIDRNSAIPCSHSQMFTTGIDDQSAVDIHVLQGERDFVADNITLGKFQLAGIERASRGVPRIEVSFDIDVSGIVNVSARDVRTGTIQQVKVTASNSLSRSDINRMTAEAERNRQQDQLRRDKVELFNRAEQLVYAAGRMLADAPGNVDAREIAEVNVAASDLQKALAKLDVEAVRKHMAELDKAIFTVSQSINSAKALLEAVQMTVITGPKEAPSNLTMAKSDTIEGTPAPPPATPTAEIEPEQPALSESGIQEQFIDV